MANDNRKLGDPGTSAFRVDKYPFYLLNRAVGRYNVIIEARLRGIGLDIPNWRVLMILGEKAPQSISQVAESAVINLSTMMRIIQRMRQTGLVSTAQGKGDRRVTEVWLTPLGEEKLAMAREITAPVYAAVIDGLSMRDFDQLIELLDRIYANLGHLNDLG